MEPERGELTIGGLALRTYGWGGDEPAILLAHGALARSGMWFPLADQLRGGHRAVAYDARGRNRAHAADYSGLAFRDELIGVVEAIADAPVVLVGHSLGALSALLTAAERPDLVLAAVLEDPPCYIDERGFGGLRSIFELGARSAGRPRVQLNEQGLPEALAATFSTIDPAMVEAMIASVDSPEREGPDSDAELTRIECPVLVVVGSTIVKPPAIPSALEAGEVERLLSHLRRGQLVRVESAGHVISGTAPDEYVAAVRPFIAEALAATS